MKKFEFPDRSHWWCTESKYNNKSKDYGTLCSFNTLLNGGWQKEESLKMNPIKIGDTFKLGIQCEEQYFKVFLNGKFLVQFKARMHPLSNIKYIEVAGEITLKQMSLSAM
ncbi:hypothetical protein FKM82_031282 [Ascaphus truei]